MEMPAALAPISTTQLAPTYTPAEFSAEPSELLASAPDTADSLGTYRAREPSSAVPAARAAFQESARTLKTASQKTELSSSLAMPVMHALSPDVAFPPQPAAQIVHMLSQPMSAAYSASPSAGMLYSAASGAYSPSLDAEIEGLEEHLLSAVYEAGFEAGYEAGLGEAHGALLSQANVTARTPSGAPIHHDSPQHPLLAAAPQSSEHLSHIAQAPAPQLELQSQPQPQAYGRYISSGFYEHRTPALPSAPAQSAGHAAASDHELSPAHALPSYAVQAAYGYQAYAYTGSYSPAEKELLGASAHAQAAERLWKHPALEKHPGAYAAPPAQGPSQALHQIMRLLELLGSSAP